MAALEHQSDLFYVVKHFSFSAVIFFSHAVVRSKFQTEVFVMTKTQIVAVPPRRTSHL